MTIKHILVVDDSPTERQFLSELLSRHGYSVSTADSAESAFRVARENRPQLILMDVVMPGQNGFQATRELSRDPAFGGVPVIICSSKHQETDRIWGLRQGARDYLVKPVDPELLLQRVAALSRTSV
jgi:twitching motility two-component system response regulator PilH